MFCLNKGLQILLILRELTKSIHLKLNLHNFVELFILRIDLNLNELSRGCALLFIPTTTSPSRIDSQ